MKERDATEIAYKNGYEKGYKEGRNDAVTHGKWFMTNYEYFICSVCGESYYNGADSTEQAKSYLNSKNTYKYCPYCGAKMDATDLKQKGE